MNNRDADNREPNSSTMNEVGPGSDRGQVRAGLVEQITRDRQTLEQLHKLGYVAHPGAPFYLGRIDAYLQSLRELDKQEDATK